MADEGMGSVSEGFSELFETAGDAVERVGEAAAVVALGAEQLTATVGEGIGTSANELGAAVDPPSDLAGPYFPDGPMPYVADDQIPNVPDDPIPYDPEGPIPYVPDGPVPYDAPSLDSPRHVVS